MAPSQDDPFVRCDSIEYNRGGQRRRQTPMQRYIVSRVLLAIPTLLGISMITFIGLRVFMPSSVVDLLVGEYGAKDEQLKKQLNEELGLSSSVPVQYVKWMGQILHGDLGKSLHSGRPVSGELRRRVPVSLELGLWGLI